MKERERQRYQVQQLEDETTITNHNNWIYLLYKTMSGSQICWLGMYSTLTPPYLAGSHRSFSSYHSYLFMHYVFCFIKTIKFSQFARRFLFCNKNFRSNSKTNRDLLTCFSQTFDVMIWFFSSFEFSKSMNT